MYDIGRSKRATQAYEFDQIAIVPSRRTRGSDEVNLAWRIDAITLEFPMMAAPMDSVMSPATAIEMGRLGGLGVLNLEGLWTRYDDPEPLFDGEFEVLGFRVLKERHLKLELALGGRRCNAIHFNGWNG
ncbi:MAG TPA: IMP dehydrogenase, partial [Propionibacteriaceae bacterium]|nr:IMP dehydrogenase [Propionibacteriaceae bacterium]